MTVETMTSSNELAAFGWTHHFQSQPSHEEQKACVPARVLAVHRNRLEVASPSLVINVPPLAEADDAATVGDWLLLDAETHVPRRVLSRFSLFRRKAAGMVQRMQPIAANVDTLFVVSSCNQDFNAARLERYLAMAREAEVTPVVVLTKADQVEDARPFLTAAMKLMPGLLAEALDARSAESAALLRPRCGVGQTVALVGSSGVGKSTLVNTLLTDDVQATAGVREDDGRGRHTTSGRSLHRLKAGGWLLDTPGMRELQIADAGDGVEQVFAEIAEVASRCRFADCRHEGEPGCAVEAALADGSIDPERLRRYRKLVAEDARNSESVHERRRRERVFGKLIKSVKADMRTRGKR